MRDANPKIACALYREDFSSHASPIQATEKKKKNPHSTCAAKYSDKDSMLISLLNKILIVSNLNSLILKTSGNKFNNRFQTSSDCIYMYRSS